MHFLRSTGAQGCTRVIKRSSFSHTSQLWKFEEAESHQRFNMTTPMSLDSGSSFNPQGMPDVEANQAIAQVGEAIGIIDSVNEYTATWNKRQCQRILKRFAEIGEILNKSLDWDRQSDDADPRQAVDGGPIYDELVQLLQKGKALVLGYSAGKIGIANVLSRTDNRDAFSEFYKELNDVTATLGFQGVDEDVEPSTTETSGLLEKWTMTNEAEEDKKEMPEILSQMLTSSGEAMEYSEKLAKVVSDKTVVDVNDNFNLALSDERAHEATLPSYLCIDLKSDVVKGEPIRKYVRKSQRDPEEQVGWAVVYSGTWLGIEYAIKVFNCRSKDAAAADWNRKQLLKEVGSLVKLQHPHVVRLVGFGQDAEESIIVMEKMDGNVREFMDLRRTSSTPERKKKPFTASEELDIANQIAKGMYFMHTIGYVHGDLKCSNIVYKNYANKCLEIKLSDLRGSQKLDSVSSDPKAIAETSQTRRPRWTAPEAIDHYGGVEPSGELLMQNDVYSFGMTCYEIVTGKYPFDGIRNEPELLERIKEGAAEKWNPLPSELDDDFKGLIISCWEKEPSKRPNFGLICHRLDMVRSKGLAAPNIRSAVATMLRGLSGIMRIPVGSQAPEQSREPGARSKRFKSSNCFDPTSQPLQSNTRALSVPEYLSIQQEDLEISEDLIGQGTSGTVHKATWLKSTFAVKILKQPYSADLKHEVDFLMKVSRHPCIVQMVGLSQISDNECSIVMEYMDFNLRTLIKARMKKKPIPAKPFTFPEEVLIIATIARGMVYLHSRGLVHLDLNSLNVLAQDYSPVVVVRIVDFGASYLEQSSNSSETTPGFYTGKGTSCFRAPEILKFNPESDEELPEGLPDPSAKADLSALKATDVYSFAMLCYEVLTGRCPCSEKSMSMTEYAAWRRYRPTYWPENSDARLKSLVQECWSMNPKKRPTFREICTRLSQFKSNQLQIESCEPLPT